MKPPVDRPEQPPPSRTQRKKADHARKALGETLVALSPEQTAAIDLPAELRAAVHLARKTRTHGARRRQIQYIGTLLRRIDTGPIQAALDNIRRGDLKKARTFRRITAWRDALQNGDEEILGEILSACPDADRQQLRQLARNARRAEERASGSAASRKLFRYLRDVSS